MSIHSHPRVIIIGGGFGGLYAARTLGNSPVHVTIIDRRNFHLFQPLLYQVATGGLSPGDIASPLRAVLNRYQNIQVLQGEVQQINPHQRRVAVLPPESTELVWLPYDFLIVATGVQHHYFGHPHWRLFAPGLKTIEDALEIRRRIFLAFEKAEWSNQPHLKQQLTTFAIVGGGPTGVELAGALGELTRFTLKKDFRNVNPTHARIILIEATERILPTYPPELSLKASRALHRLGVETFTRTRVTHIDAQSIRFQTDRGEEEIPCGTVLWAAGVQATPTAHWLAKVTQSPQDRNGRLIVAPDLSIPEHSEIFVIGDLAHYAHTTPNPLPGTAPVAMQQGRYVARRILAEISDQPFPSFRYHHKGSLAVIGRNQAVADFGQWQFSGFPAWLLWVFVHIAYLVEYDNKALVLFQWAVDYLTRKKGARLITGLPGQISSPTNSPNAI